MEIYQVDAFCKELFSGNPAAVCPLKGWLDDKLLQQIAAENNLAETAFYVESEKGLHIRWFTPKVEVDLCGHATLAAAHVMYSHKGYKLDQITFASRSGPLRVTRNRDKLTLDFPVDVFDEIELTPEMKTWFKKPPVEVFRGKTDYLFSYEDEADIRNPGANLMEIAKAKEVRGVIITSTGKEVDFVSRFFAPQSGIPEDPVTGSAHTTLTPYWSSKLKKKALTALQLSDRKGYLECVDDGLRIRISGEAKTYMKGELFI